MSNTIALADQVKAAMRRAYDLGQLYWQQADSEGGGHIGRWREKTQQFVDGLRRAAAANEPLDFH